MAAGGEADLVETAKHLGILAGTDVAITDGWLLPRRTVELQRAVPDVDEDRKRVLRYTVRYSDTACPTPAELPTAVTALLPAPSGQYSVRVLALDTKPKARTCLELWQRGSLLARIDASKHHGKVVCDGTFGGFSWSPCERKAVYVAEREVPESSSPFAALRTAGEAAASALRSSPRAERTSSQLASEAAAAPPPPGRANWFREDWGEKLGGSDKLGLFVVDFADLTVQPLAGVAEDVTPGQPCYWGDDIVYAAWPAGVRRLGLRACNQRRSSLWLARPGQTSKAHTCLTPKLKIARSPRPAPSGQGDNPSKKGPLAFLGSTDGFDTHMNVMELFVLEAPTAVPRLLLGVAEEPGHEGFAGICTDTALPRQCWAAGRIYLNTFVASMETAWSVNLEDDTDLRRVERPKGAHPMASLRVLAAASSAASDAAVLLSCSTPTHPSSVAVRVLEDSTDVPLPPLGPCTVAANIPRSPDYAEGIKWHVHGVTPKNGGARFDAILMELTEPGELPGLILNLHGGPHGVSTTSFGYELPFLMHATRCAVLSVNYRGSLGFGRRALETLPGKCGSQDVEDCMDALRAALESGLFDRSRVAVVGGSHGGFLASHLVGQHPDVFKVAVMRNPVTNLATMATATDIPDWVAVEGQGLGSYDFESPRPPSGEALQALFAASPMAHVGKVKAAVMLGLGLCDRRVPPSQGMEYYYALRAVGATARLLRYEKETHAIDGAAASADFWVNTAAFFDEHMPQVAVPGPVQELSRASSLGV